jgi:predicted RNase H-like nuclease (RuvC/YqgF family)
MIVSVAFFGVQLITPVGAATSTVSGEAKLKASSTQMKKSLLQRKIRVMKSELKKTAAAIALADKRIVDMKAKGKSVTILENRLQKLKEKQTTQEAAVAKLEAELALIK